MAAEQFTTVATNAGELDSLMLGRGDLQKFHMGCITQENARVLRVGGAHRRAGLKYVSPLVDERRKARLEGFNFSSGQGFVLEFSHYTLRIYQNGEQVKRNNAVVSLDTPWSEDQVFGLDFAQRIDDIIIAHEGVPVQVLTRNTDTDWSIALFPWQERIWELATAENITLTPSATTGDITITASEDFFDESWVGTRLRLVHSQDESITDGIVSEITDLLPYIVMSTGSAVVGEQVAFQGDSPISYWTTIANYNGPGGDYVSGKDSPADYPTFFSAGLIAVPAQDVRGSWTFETFGSWNGTYVIERSYNDGGTWEAVKTLTSARDKNYLVEDEEEYDANASFRVLIVNFDFNIDVRFAFTAASVSVGGVALITEYLTPTMVGATVEIPFESATSTTEWYEEAFSPKNGYPKAVTFHQKRLVFGGSLTRPQYVWLSRTKKPYDFTQGTLADDGMSFQLDAMEYESVMWIVSHLALVIGTTSTEWAISAPDGRAITPESNRQSFQTSHGSAPGIPGVTLQNNVIFLQKAGRKVRELTGGSVEYGGYLAADLTQLASHITEGGVDQISRGEVPDSTLFMVVGGQLAVLTYERSQNVVGWTRWVTDGEIESFGTCTGGGEDDDIYVVVKRGDRRFVEYLTPDMLRVEEAAKVDVARMPDLMFLDSYVLKESQVAFTTLDGLDHLEGYEVEAFADGEPAGTHTVEGGQITLPLASTKAIAGLPFITTLTPMPEDGGVVGKKSASYELHIRVRNTLGAQVRQNDQPLSATDWNNPRVTADTPLPLQTGDYQFTPHGNWTRLPTISIVQTMPYPMTVLAIRSKLKAST